jgi:hypothetical protein
VALSSGLKVPKVIVFSCAPPPEGGTPNLPRKAARCWQL